MNALAEVTRFDWRGIAIISLFIIGLMIWDLSGH